MVAVARFKPTGSGLERARLAAGLSLPEVATALTRHPASVRAWERGTTTPPQAAMVALANLYAVPVSALVGGGAALPGAGDAVALLRAHEAGDRDAVAEVVLAVHGRGFAAMAALVLNLANIAKLAAGNLDGLLDTVQAQLVDA